MSVTAVIPVWNGRELLMKLLDSMETQSVKFQEILVVDNGSQDGAPQAAFERGARVISLGRNMGFAHAVNHGARAASTEHLAILNSDVELHPAWLNQLLAARAPFATGKILSAADPALMDGAFDLLCRGGCPWRAGNGKRDEPGIIEGTPIAMASFTAILIERQAYLKVGLLDERFESYLEDVDFGLRCVAGGVHGVYVPEAICKHHGSATLGRWNNDSVRRISRNQVFLLKKYYPRSLILRWGWQILVAHLLWGVLAVRHGAGWGWAKGKWEGVQTRLEAPEPIPDLQSVLCEQEAEIYRLQERFGMDWYWRVYFALTGAKRHRQTHE